MTTATALAATSFTLDGDVVIRIVAAALLGATVGLEREMNDQPAGLRTHIAVAVGAALFGVISTLGFVEFDRPRAETTLQADVTRVASNVVVGIGFLGAGVIFRQGTTIKNLTTAASLWAVAAIGLAAGIGNPVTAALATLVLLASLVVLRPLRSVLRQRWSRRTIVVELTTRPRIDPFSLIESTIDAGVDVNDVAVEKHDGLIVLRVTLSGHPEVLRTWATRIVTSDDVESLAEV